MTPEPAASAEADAALTYGDGYDAGYADAKAESAGTLDAKRLGDAIWNVMYPGEGARAALGEAEAIAAEYERLAEADPTPRESAGTLDVETVASALYETDPPASWMRTGTDEYRKRAAAMLAVIERDARLAKADPDV